MAKTPRHAPTRRCAIYTRKSSEEGLEHALHGALVKGDVPSVAVLAAREQVRRPYMLRLMRLAYLAPDIVEAILTGRSALTVNRLMKQLHLPLDWISQRRAVGLG